MSAANLPKSAHGLCFSVMTISEGKLLHAHTQTQKHTKTHPLCPSWLESLSSQTSVSSSDTFDCHSRIQENSNKNNPATLSPPLHPCLPSASTIVFHSLQSLPFIFSFWITLSFLVCWKRDDREKQRRRARRRSQGSPFFTTWQFDGLNWGMQFILTVHLWWQTHTQTRRRQNLRQGQ